MSKGVGVDETERHCLWASLARYVLVLIVVLPYPDAGSTRLFSVLELTAARRIGF